MKLETDAVINFLRERGGVELFCAFVGKLGKIVGFELDAVEFVYAAQLCNLLLALFARQGVLAVLVAGELAEQVFFGELLPPKLFRSELFGNGEEGHNGVGLQVVELYLVQYLASVRQSFWEVAEDSVHLRPCLEPFLFAVEQAVRVVQVLACREAEQQVVGFGVVLVEEVGVVCADNLYAVLSSQFYEDGVDALLHLEEFAIGFLVGVRHFMALQLDVVVVAPNVVEPFDGLFCSSHIASGNLLWQFAANAGRADDEAFVELLQVFVVGSGLHVEAVHPSSGNKFDEVVIARQVLGQYDEVPARLVLLSAFVHTLVAAASHIHLAAEDGLEGFQPVLLPVLVHGLAVVVQLLDPEHVSVVGESHAAHSVLDGFIDHAFY